MLKLGRAQGVAMAAALYKNLPVYEYAPRKIKLAVTGRGNASKEQVLKMLENIFKQPIDPLFMDASDGLAAAVCHAYQSGNITGGVSIHKPKAKSGWNAYLSAHPEKIKGKKP
jgi:crossover junction endodeoxyribonuclease RuvC